MICWVKLKFHIAFNFNISDVSLKVEIKFLLKAQKQWVFLNQKLKFILVGIEFWPCGIRVVSIARSNFVDGKLPIPYLITKVLENIRFYVLKHIDLQLALELCLYG